jgi:dephospho-CoA kinase
MLRLGITGGIGSGKSTVCGFLEEWGARVFYADSEAKRLMVDNPEVRSQIIEAFGTPSYREDGTLNRKFLAGRVFGDEAQVGVLNAIVHPPVYQAFERFAEKAMEEGAALVVREAALMLEGSGRSGLDLVVAVLAPVSTRLRRVGGRDRTEEAAVRSRMQHQLTETEFRARADRVMENNGTLAELRQKTAELFSDLVEHRP